MMDSVERFPTMKGRMIEILGDLISRKIWQMDEKRLLWHGFKVHTNQFPSSMLMIFWPTSVDILCLARKWYSEASLPQCLSNSIPSSMLHSHKTSVNETGWFGAVGKYVLSRQSLSIYYQCNRAITIVSPWFNLVNCDAVKCLGLTDFSL